MKSQPTVTSTFASRTSPSTDQSLQKSLQLSNPDKIELKKFPTLQKNKKYPTAQPDTTMTMKRSIDNGLQGRTERRPAYNTGLAKVAVQCSADTFVVNQSLVLRINICGENATFAKPETVMRQLKRRHQTRKIVLTITQL